MRTHVPCSRKQTLDRTRRVHGMYAEVGIGVGVNFELIWNVITFYM